MKEQGTVTDVDLVWGINRHPSVPSRRTTNGRLCLRSARRCLSPHRRTPPSTFNGLHVIPTEERDFGNVFQSTIRGRWESLGVFHCITGERLIVEADGWARWRVDD